MNLNLDCMDAEDLMTFWVDHQRGRAAAALFPEAPRRGLRRVVGDLANYASNRATAHQCRARGDIEAALIYEAICDRIYGALPEWARW